MAKRKRTSPATERPAAASDPQGTERAEGPPSLQRVPRWAWLAAAVVLLAGTVVRVVAARDNFWFDEVWSLFLFSLPAESPWAVLAYHHDNNHQLVSLWMYFCGLCDSWFVYRIPSLLAGLATIALAGEFARRRSGNWGAISAAVLTAGSFVLITYASEARGYALCGAFALAACLVLQRYLARGGMGACALFAMLVILGFLSHLTFLFGYLGMLAWSLAAPWHARKSVPAIAREAALCHAAPLLFLAALYVWHVRPLMIGGGPVYSIWKVVAETAAAMLGGVGGHPTVNQGLALAAVAGLLVGLVWLARANWPLALLFVVTIVVAPALVLGVQRPPLLYVRYFYVPVLFALLLAGLALGQLAQRGSRARGAVGLVLGFYLLANILAVAPFLESGRGQYLAALEYLGSKSPEFLFQSDHDFETERMLAFYARYLPPDWKPVYLAQSDRSGRIPQWTIVNSQELPAEAAGSIFDAQGRRYDLDRVFPYAGLSGYHWKVYRLASSAEDGSSGTRPPSGS